MSSKTILWIVALGSILILGVLPVMAGYSYHGGEHCGKMAWDMGTLDSNQNGEVTFEEYTAPKLEKWRSGFDMIDSDGNGVIETNEWETFRSVHGKSKQ